MTVPINQGTVNRLRGSVVYATRPDLTVTAAYLAKEAISIAFEGDAAQKLGTLTGAVDSPEPYVMATVELHLLRTQALADAYKLAIETNTSVGSINVIGDADTLSDYQIEQCVILGVQGLDFNGNSPNFTVRLKGVYYVNGAIWIAS
jgi:hypothetical protein